MILAQLVPMGIPLLDCVFLAIYSHDFSLPLGKCWKACHLAQGGQKCLLSVPERESQLAVSLPEHALANQTPSAFSHKGHLGRTESHQVLVCITIY